MSQDALAPSLETAGLCNYFSSFFLKKGFEKGIKTKVMELQPFILFISIDLNGTVLFCFKQCSTFLDI